MVISKESQLGLRFKDREVKAHFYSIMKEYFEKEYKATPEFLMHATGLDCPLPAAQYLLDIKRKKMNPNDCATDENDGGYWGLPISVKNSTIRKKVTEAIVDIDIINEGTPPPDHPAKTLKEHKYYLVCKNVWEAAKLIKISEHFTATIFKDIKEGKYTYLLGKNMMVRFIVANGAMKGFAYNDEYNKAFEWGCDTVSGEYFFQGFQNDFSAIMQLLTFIELGDITIKVIEGLRHNGLKKAEKIYNASTATVYVVDSVWNQIILRTTGFAVRGHYRLQPCGKGLAFRKLIWISAFEKEGYTKTIQHYPKARIEGEMN